MRIVVGHQNHSRIQELRRVVLGEGLHCEFEDVVPLARLAARITEASPDLVLLISPEQPAELLDVIKSVHQVTGAPILAAAASPEVETLRKAVRAGAREVLDLDRFDQELREVLVELEPEVSRGGHRGDVFATYSPCGGAGVSTVAINLADQLGRKTRDRVALVDLKPAPGDLALLLDLVPKYTVDDVCRHWHRLDRQMLEHVMNRNVAHLDILAQREGVRGDTSVRDPLHPRAVQRLVNLLRCMYGATVLDLSHESDCGSREAMGLANWIGLVIRPEIPDVRRAGWFLEDAVAHGLQRERFHLVLNQCESRGQVSRARIEQILDMEVFHMIPADHRLARRAINEGIPLAHMSRISRIQRSFAALARRATSQGRSSLV